MYGKAFARLTMDKTSQAQAHYSPDGYHSNLDSGSRVPIVISFQPRHGSGQQRILTGSDRRP
jgi:hypothetical protein